MNNESRVSMNLKMKKLKVLLFLMTTANVSQAKNINRLTIVAESSTVGYLQLFLIFGLILFLSYKTMR